MRNARASQAIRPSWMDERSPTLALNRQLYMLMVCVSGRYYSKATTFTPDLIKLCAQAVRDNIDAFTRGAPVSWPKFDRAATPLLEQLNVNAAVDILLECAFLFRAYMGYLFCDREGAMSYQVGRPPHRGGGRPRPPQNGTTSVFMSYPSRDQNREHRFYCIFGVFRRFKA